MLQLQNEPSFLHSHSVGQIALILGGVAIGALALAALAFFVRSRWLLAAVLALGVVQFFGPFGFTSIALLVTCTFLPVAFWRVRAIRGAPFIWGLVLGGLAVWQAISSLWSEKLGSAGYAVVFSVALLTAFLLALDVVRRDPAGAPRAVAAASPLIIASGLLVVLFRVLPRVEAGYLLSPIARFFSEPDVILVSRSEVNIALDPVRSLGLFADVARPSGSTGLLEGLFVRDDLTYFQNVLDPAKAGGVFLNGNTASMFFGVTACVAIWALATSRTTGGGRPLAAVHATTAIVSVAALVATGSKTALLLLVGLPVLAFFIGWAVRRPRAGTIVGVVGVLGAAGGITAMLVARPGLLTSSTLADRLGLWRMVSAAFPERWFFGFGFGNWRFHVVEEWPHYFPNVATQVWPPHNLFLMAWTDAGLVSLVLVLIVVLVPLVAALRRMGEARFSGSAATSADPAGRRPAPLFGSAAIARAAVFVGLAWIVVHGMADTTTYGGDNHTLPFAALLTALALTAAPAAAPRPPHALLPTPPSE